MLLPMIGFFVTSLAAFLCLTAVATFERPPVRSMVFYVAMAALIVGTFQVLMANVLVLRMPAGLLF
jgi:putative tricarboxylic transport membrane protein